VKIKEQVKAKEWYADLWILEKSIQI